MTLGVIGSTVLSPFGLAPLAPTFAQSAPTAPTPVDGVPMLRQLTLTRGAVYLPGALQGAATTHWWVSDATFGLCRVDPAATNPPYQLNQNTCNVTAKSAGQVVVADPDPSVTGLPAGAKFVFVADDSSKSANVVRLVWNPATETLGSARTITVQATAAKGGGSTTAARPVALALGGKTGNDLYVGYLKSGDVMKVAAANTNSVANPIKVGSTSDGVGVNSFVMFNGDLYLAELGGLGLSVIRDPSGVARPACASAAPCVAQTVSPLIDSFPGGLATDGTNIYVGQAPTTFGTGAVVKRWNPATGALDVYSQNVPPYTPTALDGVTRSQYMDIVGLAVGPNGDLLVGDDPSANLVAPTVPTLQGSLYKVPAQPNPPVIATIAPDQGSLGGGTVVNVAGTGLAAIDPTTNQVIASSTTATFNGISALSVSCASTTQCTITSPPASGAGTVDLRVAVHGQQSAIAPADRFTYVANPVATGAPTIASISPTQGLAAGGTQVTITGSNLAAAGATTTVAFGTVPATSVACAVEGTSCTAVSPAGTGAVAVQVTVNGATSAASAADQFTYTTPQPALYAWGITAPKGGAIWVPGALGGHWWSSDHAQGFCRQDPVSGTTLHAISYGSCGPDIVGSAGQAVYDPRVNPDGTHYIYVPDNAVKSTAVWRLTFNPSNETVSQTAEAMIPLADVRTLKPNGMAIGPDGNLYVSDLTEKYIRKITNPNGDPRTQTVGVVAQTGDGRGANGTMGFIDSRLYVSENRAAAWFDINTCPVVDPTTATPCNTTPIPLPSGAFVAGVATDQTNKLVYASDSPGGAGATIWRYDAHLDGQALAPGQSLPTPVIYAKGGPLPGASSPDATVYCALTCTRPWDTGFTQGGTASWSFVFGMAVGPNHELIITEDGTAGNRSGRGTMWQVPLVP
jgi:hypothetical protein